jgi:hypothetical protein
MAQVLKSTKDFESFGGLNPGTVRVSTENSKAAVILRGEVLIVVALRRELLCLLISSDDLATP